MIDGNIKYVWSNTFSAFQPSGYELVSPNSESIRGHGLKALCGWLLSEIGESLGSIEIWLDNVKKVVLENTHDGDFGIGNAYWTFINRECVFIACEYSEEQKILISIDQFVYVLSRYKTCLIDDSSRDKDRAPNSIDVKYIAEGDQAVKIYSEIKGAHTYIFN